MGTSMVTLPASALTEAVEALARVGCQFFACQGPDAPFEPMATCRVCAAVQDLRKIIANAREED